ncbi:MAG TPA: hypothetical protein PKM50_04185 [Methanoregula sp.]|nr:hypothetical protein [Methanoregula sp.]
MLPVRFVQQNVNPAGLSTSGALLTAGKGVIPAATARHAPPADRNTLRKKTCRIAQIDKSKKETGRDLFQSLLQGTSTRLGGLTRYCAGFVMAMAVMNGSVNL